NGLGFVGDIIEHFGVRISPDGGRFVVDIFEPKSRTQNLWMYDFARGTQTRFTSGLAVDIGAAWSPDGKEIAYASLTAGSSSIRIRSALGGGGDEVLIESRNRLDVTDWSPDGTVLCITRRGEPTQADIWIHPLTGEKKMWEFVKTAYRESDGRFSPDGRWVAYTSDETGRSEIYLRPYPGPGTATKVSTTGGDSPVWRRDGREIFYISTDNKMMAAEIRVSGSTVVIGTEQELFTRTPIMSDYDVFPDGKRFLINRTIEPTGTDPLTIFVNWTEKLKK
ncbi:MAG: PD40 domain-containing protein, partial [Ignavibacteriales bacterium]|nr:PD40 domain-containing protein [Ignavibacteriales bacterium]